MSENWKTDGNCKECRRKSYCSKACTANKRRAERFVKESVAGILKNFISKIEEE